MSVAVFAVAYLLLFFGMNRQCNLYDEAIVLTDAMRVAAGNVPHRDFYVNYGPAEFYLLAWLFKIFGQSVLVERLLDLFFKAGIVAACFAWITFYCNKTNGLVFAAVCWLWLASFIYYGPPVMPALLLSLVGSSLLLSAYPDRKSNWRIPAAGAATGLTALFRYDVGFGLLTAHLCFIGIEALVSNGTLQNRLRNALLIASKYVAGTAAVFSPAALIYLAVAPLHDFVADIITYPSKYYARARTLPFPGIHLHGIENLAVYLPVLTLALLLALFFMERLGLNPDQSSLPAPGRQHLNRFFLLFGLIIAVFYGKGWVRVSPYHMFLSIAPSLVVLGVLLGRARSSNIIPRIMIGLVTFFAVITGVDAIHPKIAPIRRYCVLRELMSPPGPASIRDLTSWCGTPNPLHTGLCFLVDADHIKAIQFIDSHTAPEDQLFVGLPHHDKILDNDILTYFATQRMPATHWHHFDPDLQTRADIQQQMISEIESKPVPYILLDSEFGNSQEPNDSSRSSGVTLLDDFIRNNYQQVQSFGELSVWQRKSPQR